MSPLDDTPYEARRNPNLPWGYWILVDAVGDPSTPLIDERGHRWESLRQALWQGRLNMGVRGPLSRYAEEQIAFLLAVLAAIDRRIVWIGEAVTDLFDGSWHRTAHYAQWLSGHRLIEHGDLLTNAKLTLEGRAVLRLLATTRDRKEDDHRINLSSLDQFAQLRSGRDEAELNRQIIAAEAALPPMAGGFVRRELGGKAAIVLIGPADARLTLRETNWSITMPSRYERDVFYSWMLRRADRWEAWAKIVRDGDARALTEHLLTLFVAAAADDASP